MGSQARGVATRLFDVDMNIAVYFYPKTTHHIEYEEKVYYEHEDIIWREVERILKREVELLVLNRACQCFCKCHSRDSSGHS